MDRAEFARINKQLDRMDDRVRKVIARRKPLQLDHSGGQRKIIAAPPPRPQRQAPGLAKDPGYSAIASGQLEGNEPSWGATTDRRGAVRRAIDRGLEAPAALPDYEPPACRDDAPGFDYTRDVIFAEFNR